MEAVHDDAGAQGHGKDKRRAVLSVRERHLRCGHVTLRISKFNKTLVDLLQPQEDVVPVVLLNQVEEPSIVADELFDDGFDFDGQDIDCILDTILDTLAFDQIPDRLLFGEEA